MNNKITEILLNSRKIIIKHSPEILTGMGIVGMISSGIVAVANTPKAIKILDNVKEDKHVDKLNFKDTIKYTWKLYLPSVLFATASSACIIGATSMNLKRNATLATAYAISEKTLTTYKNKVVETLGDKKEKKIRESISQDRVNNTDQNTIILTNKGDTLFMDSISGRYFKSDIDIVNNIVNELNRQMVIEHYISLDDLYYELGLDPIKNGDDLGWNLDDGLIEIDYNTCLANNNKPCIVLDFVRDPKYDYDKFM